MPIDREPPNLPALVRALAQAGVAYVVSGSTAALLHGVDVAPGDLDIVPALDTTNLERLRAALDAVDARPDPDGPFGSWVQDATGEHRWVEHEPGPGERAARHDWRPDPGDPSTFDEQLLTRFGALDIVPAVSGSYRDLADRASRLHAFDAELLVASIADLLAVLTVARRPKDVPRVAGLRAIQVRSSAGPSRRGRYAVGMFPREDTRGPQEGAWLVEAIERARAQLASIRFDKP